MQLIDLTVQELLQLVTTYVYMGILTDRIANCIKIICIDNDTNMVWYFISLVIGCRFRSCAFVDNSVQRGDHSKVVYVHAKYLFNCIHAVFDGNSTKFHVEITYINCIYYY